MKAKLFIILTVSLLLSACCSSTNFDVGNVFSPNCGGSSCHASNTYYESYSRSSCSSGSGCGASTYVAYDRCSHVYDNVGGFDGPSACSSNNYDMDP